MKSLWIDRKFEKSRNSSDRWRSICSNMVQRILHATGRNSGDSETADVFLTRLTALIWRHEIITSSIHFFFRFYSAAGSPLMTRIRKRCKSGFESSWKAPSLKEWRSWWSDTRSASTCKGDYVEKWCHRYVYAHTCMKINKVPVSTAQNVYFHTFTHSFIRFYRESISHFFI